MKTDVFVYHVDVRKNHAYFKGHFPTFPVFPAIGQLALLQHAIEAYHEKECEIIALPMAKFLQPIVPDIHLVIELHIEGHGCMSFIMTSEQQTFAKGKLCYRMKYNGS